jgi:hypothetical protein
MLHIRLTTRTWPMRSRPRRPAIAPSTTTRWFELRAGQKRLVGDDKSGNGPMTDCESPRNAAVASSSALGSNFRQPRSTPIPYLPRFGGGSFSARLAFPLSFFSTPISPARGRRPQPRCHAARAGANATHIFAQESAKVVSHTHPGSGAPPSRGTPLRQICT